MGEATHAKVTAEGYRGTFVPLSEIRRLRRTIKDPVKRSEVLAQAFRINTLYMIQVAGSGHIGTSLSSLDIATYLWSEVMRDPNGSSKHSDVYFSSKGHDAPALYALLIGLEKLPLSMLEKLRRFGGLPGHPDVHTPFMATNTGSLGMGISKARGMARAYREGKRTGTMYVMLGDGELQEGQLWESLQPTANQRYANIVAIVDHNKIQSDTWVKDTSDLGDLEAKFRAFGWKVYRVDGHNVKALARAIAVTKKEKKRPQIIIADTVKGKGVPELEKVDAKKIYNFHSGALDPEAYARACDHLIADINRRLRALRIGTLAVEEKAMPVRVSGGAMQSLVRAHAASLVAHGKKNKKFIAMDADLAKDLGLLHFKDAFPDRYVQAGIAEQDMVSFAGGLALKDVTPIVHSFACFMIPRANEQIYNNATEETKVIYVGGLAGILPGMPGHSHQSVRDISIMSAHPNLLIIEPTDEGEVERALDFALNAHAGSTYIRLVSVPWTIPFAMPRNSLARPGVGAQVRKGTDLTVFAYGPILTSEAYAAAEALDRDGISVKIVAMPWLNTIDEKWLASVSASEAPILALDNHYIKGGLGEQLGAALARIGSCAPFYMHGITEIPAFGQNDEVLAYHKLDRFNLEKLMRSIAKRS